MLPLPNPLRCTPRVDTSFCTESFGNRFGCSGSGTPFERGDPNLNARRCRHDPHSLLHDPQFLRPLNLTPAFPEFHHRDREVDGLQQRVGRRPHLRLRRRRPMAEGEEADVFHGRVCGDDAFSAPYLNRKSSWETRVREEHRIFRSAASL